MGLAALKNESEAVMEGHEDFAKLEERSRNIENNLARLEGKVDRLDAKVDLSLVETRKEFQRLESKMDAGFIAMKDESKKDLKWTMGIFGGGVVALATLMYFLFSRITLPVAEVKAVSAIPAPLQIPAPSKSAAN